MVLPTGKIRRLLVILIAAMELMLLAGIAQGLLPLPFEGEKVRQENLVFPWGSALYPKPLSQTWAEFSEANRAGEIQEIRAIKLEAEPHGYTLFYQGRWQKGGGVVETKDSKSFDWGYDLSHYEVSAQGDRLTLYLRRQGLFWLQFIWGGLNFLATNVLIFLLVWLHSKVGGTVIVG